MIDGSFVKKLQELLDAYNRCLQNNSGNDVPNIDKELQDIMEKLEHYIRRFS